jgi:hypothetical protein
MIHLFASVILAIIGLWALYFAAWGVFWVMCGVLAGVFWAIAGTALGIIWVGSLPWRALKWAFT